MNKSKKNISRDFAQTVNSDATATFTLKQLNALNKLLDGKATKKDYEVLYRRAK
jgi:hypothetical protein